jgi:hypothetical protein
MWAAQAQKRGREQWMDNAAFAELNREGIFTTEGTEFAEKAGKGVIF